MLILVPIISVFSSLLVSGEALNIVLDKSSSLHTEVDLEIKSEEKLLFGDPDVVDVSQIFSDLPAKYEEFEELELLGGIDYSCLHASSWILNANNHGDKSSIFSTATEVITSTASGNSWTITTNQIPYYNFNFTADVIASLNSRPKRSTDFKSGYITAEVNTVYPYGSDIGYASKACSLGYWPPGPVCPIAQRLSISFPMKPAQEISSGKFKNFNINFNIKRQNFTFLAAGCEGSRGGAIGWFLNGVAYFGWSDMLSYNDKDIWQNTAPNFEQYDNDPCLGHAAADQYHRMYL